MSIKLNRADVPELQGIIARATESGDDFIRRAINDRNAHVGVTEFGEAADEAIRRFQTKYKTDIDRYNAAGREFGASVNRAIESVFGVDASNAAKLRGLG